MQQSEIRTVELSIQDAEKAIDLGRRAEALSRNPDFMKVVLDGYFKEEAIRLTHLVSAPNLPEANRSMVEKDIWAIGAFRRFLETQMHFGQAAEADLATLRMDLDDLHAEAVEE